MFNGSETTATVLIFLVALGILGWGFNRARSYGKLGILAWLQSVVLTVPWLVFFGLFAAGIYLNLVGILFLLVASAGLYIVLGKRLRKAGQEQFLQERAKTLLNEKSGTSEGEKPEEAEGKTPENLTSSASGTSPATSEVVPIPSEDLKSIQGIFGIDTFFATETIPYQEGVIFKGNLRGNDPEEVHSRLSASLEERLDDRYRLFLVEDPEGKPVTIVLPSSNDPQPATVPQKILSIILLIATIATTLEAAGLLLNFDFFNTPERFQDALPISIGIWTVFAVHEMGHWWAARRYQVRLSLPFLIPSWQIGSFGAITRFESLIPNRQALFDIALAGPAAGGIVSLLMLMGGLLLSHQGSAFQVPVQFFQGSVLVGGLARLVLGSSLHNAVVDVHPLTVVGWLGLVVTALNLMPAGQLDGGRVVQAIYGRKTARRATIATLVLLGIVALVNPANPLILYWAIVILFLQRSLERPSLNEITEPDDTRAILGLLALFLMVATLIPLTPAVAARLGIGT
ncbi:MULTISPECIES: site-2 protease family protein [unclassified Coleofasciculus]|uniref:site-2 protease family protein n=1 Tax=unclassified Coleofasciculus TaxID=2692782 RepID=UPI001880D333|nr:MULTISPECIES: site-2 protease family protein [unclassified Coleofasciculus]MBE9125313.1 site-2 protease family protein [Coleofasciculus sp. LEGE 07081]MBE9148517.1 site-2 protease family protein [Coleofasciculus sp. LEGE 07092]